MANHDLVKHLQQLPPTNGVLAVLANAESGYYANVPPGDLARDLEGVNEFDEASRKAWCDSMCKSAAAGEYQQSQERAFRDAQKVKAEAARAAELRAREAEKAAAKTAAGGEKPSQS